MEILYFINLEFETILEQQMCSIYFNCQNLQRLLSPSHSSSRPQVRSEVQSICTKTIVYLCVDDR